MIRFFILPVIILSVILLASCATSNSGGVPKLGSKDKIEKMADTQWQEMIAKMGLSENMTEKARFKSVANKVIAASFLSNEDWDVELFEGQNPLVFALPGNRLGGRGIETMSCLLYTSPSPRDATLSRMPSSA